MRSASTAALLLLACAAARVPAPNPSSPVGEPLAHAGGKLGVELARFQGQSLASRTGSATGAPMPEGEVRAWAQLLDAVDAEAATATVPALVSLRLQLEAELEADSARFGDLPRALAERRTETLRALSARIATLTPRPARADPAHFLWPTSPTAVTSPWGDRLHPIFGEVRFHAGVDLGADLAQEVRAAGPGTVVFAGWNGAHGKQLELQHDAHLSTRYSHLMTLLVGVGKKVQRGEVIGLAGQTGQATGPHLHFELRVDGESVDPESLLPSPQEPVHARSER